MIFPLNHRFHRNCKIYLVFVLLLFIFISMDINRIFNLFGKDPINSPFYTRKEVEDIQKLEDFKETPMFKLGMFKKIIFNHLSYKDRIINLFRNIKPELNIFELEEAGETITFERGWEFIRQCSLDKEEWQESLKVYNTKEFKKAIKLTLNFYKGLEEYEKCAYLKEILDYLKKDLALQK